MAQQIFSDFEVLKNSVTADERGRIVLGDSIKDQQFQVLRNEEGELLLIPVVTIPKREAWLFQNEKALNAVKKGLKHAKEGKLNNGPNLKAAAALAKKIAD